MSRVAYPLVISCREESNLGPSAESAIYELQSLGTLIHRCNGRTELQTKDEMRLAYTAQEETMEIIHNGRKIVSTARRIGTSWLLETTIWPPTSDGSDDPQLIQTIGAASESEEEAHTKAIKIGQQLIDADCI